MHSPCPAVFSSRMRSEPNSQSFARDLQTLRAQCDTVSFARATRTARMDHQIINAEQQCALNFFAKRLTRFLQHHIIRGREVHEIVAVNQDRREFRELARLSKQHDVFDA